MNDILKLTEKEQKQIIEQVSTKTNFYPQIIEKDLWITIILQIIFSLPFAENLVFKGGTSLSKVWNLIQRFSEDIDLAIAREQLDLPEGDLTVKQIKKMRKQSSLFVKDFFCTELQKAIEKYGLKNLLNIEPQPDGEGDKTYPEPRKIFIRYRPIYDDIPYMKSEIALEISARSLFEPTEKCEIKSLISENTSLDFSIVNSQIITATPNKTFLEKAFLLHEFFTAYRNVSANRKSRHLYDLERMMDCDFAVKAIADNELWETIRHHREVFTHVNGVDYTPDVRKRIILIPPESAWAEWKNDYETMCNSMIYGEKLTFDKLMERINELQKRFRN
jgi:hypothetical protein